MLLEKKLQFERFMNLDQIEVSVMECCDLKFREQMDMTKHIARRDVGMKSNTLNHHGMVHAHQDVINLGVPTNYNTRPNEGFHKDDKKDAAKTSRKPDTWDYDNARRGAEREVVDLGICELDGHPRWDYFLRKEDGGTSENPNAAEPFETHLTGVTTTFYMEPGSTDVVHSSDTNMKGKVRFGYDQPCLDRLKELYMYLVNYLPGKKMKVRTFLNTFDTRAKDNRQQYKAHPLYYGKPWHDWGMFDLSTPDKPGWDNYVPCHMQAFVDLSELPEGLDLQFGGEDLDAGLYALIEPTRRNSHPEEQGRGEMIDSWVKRLPWETGVEGNRIDFVSVEKLLAPAILIPDLENTDRRAFLRVKPRSEWVEIYKAWLKADHERMFPEEVQP
jgi:hypothetical protein